jgi:Putative Actinobacterial Holin-X, holin superfamily III
MADQTALTSGNGSPGSMSPAVGDHARISAQASSAALRGETPAGDLVSNVAGFGENLLSLAELQARMAAVELRQNVETVKIASALVVAGVLIALAAVPIILMGMAELLVSELAWRRGHAFLAVGCVTVALAACCAVAAAAWLKRQRLGFPLSTEELTRNLHWVHTVLRLSGRHPTHRG